MELELDKFYKKHLSEFGSSAQGVGWKNKEAQLIRFIQLFRVVTTSSFTINDLGCGVGDLVDFLNEKDLHYQYHGYDTMQEMITRAQEKYDNQKNLTFKKIEDAQQMVEADYTIASGIFNIKFTLDDKSWLEYIIKTLDEMNRKSIKGFAFNILTKYSDAEYMKKELYYADPLFLFDYCKNTYSKNVALLHDYNQYDFTIIVRKDF